MFLDRFLNFECLNRLPLLIFFHFLRVCGCRLINKLVTKNRVNLLKILQFDFLYLAPLSYKPWVRWPPPIFLLFGGTSYDNFLKIPKMLILSAPSKLSKKADFGYKKAFFQKRSALREH